MYMDEQIVIELSDVRDYDVVNFHKMLFVYNAVLNGWTVKLANLQQKDKFEFVKKIDDENTRREVNLADYITKFVLRNLQLPQGRG